MRIDLHYNPQASLEPNRGTSATQNNESAAAASARIASGEDQAQLSSAHVQVQALVAGTLQLPEVREAKIQALRQAIQSGQYNPDPRQVAASVVAHMTASAA